MTLLRFAVMVVTLRLAEAAGVRGWDLGLVTNVVVTFLAVALMTRRGLWRVSGATLRWLGAIFLLGFPLATFVERSFTEWFFSAGVWTGGPLPPGGVAIKGPLLSGPAILAAVSVFAHAEVFAYGARLREDVDATI